MPIAHQAVATLLTTLLLATASTASHAEAPTTAGLHLTDLQVIGSHNSYKQAIDRPLLKLMTAIDPTASGLDYSHLSLTEQLNLGLRGLELDLYNDPEGRHYAQPAGLALVKGLGEEPAPYDPEKRMLEPGFKVLHVQDVDFRSSQLTLRGALQELRDWSQQHAGHLPVVITVNLNDDALPYPIPGGTKPVPYDRQTLDRLDQALRESLTPGRLFTPDDARGNHASLEQAILEEGWPLVDAMRGKFLWVIDDAGRKRDWYIENHQSLRNRAMFTNSAPGTPEAAVLILNNPIGQQEEIQQRVEQGYLVRTRADAETREARQNDYRRFEAAQRSGAYLISTDYYRADERIAPEYHVRFADGKYVRAK